MSADPTYDYQMDQLLKAACVYRRQLAGLLTALERIAGHEYRADRRHTGMVDMDEIITLQRIARVALSQVGEPT